MPKTLKIIIGFVSILATMTTALFLLNKELPGCFSPNFFSKIKTDVGCFELLAVPASNIKSNGISKLEIENTAKIYFKKISSVIKDNDLKINYFISWVGYGSSDYDTLNFYIKSPKIEGLNPNVLYPNSAYNGDGNFIKNKSDINSEIIFQGFRIPEGETASYEKEFNKLLQSYYPNIKLN